MASNYQAKWSTLVGWFYSTGHYHGNGSFSYIYIYIYFKRKQNLFFSSQQHNYIKRNLVLNDEDDEQSIIQQTERCPIAQRNDAL